MQRGAKEVELEKAEEAQFRRHARGFRWAKEDEARDANQTQRLARHARSSRVILPRDATTLSRAAMR